MEELAFVLVIAVFVLITDEQQEQIGKLLIKTPWLSAG